MAGWYIRRGEKIVGPVEVAKLQELVSTGRLLPTDELAKDVAGPWQIASSTKLFAPKANPPAIIARPVAMAVAETSPEPAVQSKGFKGHLSSAAASMKRAMAVRAERKHEIKMAKIQATAAIDARRAEASVHRAAASHVSQATNIKVVNKGGSGCSGCVTILLLLFLAVVGVIIYAIINAPK